MKIINRGVTPDEEIVWKSDCKYCKSELEATRTELKVEWDQRESGELGRAICPVCKRDTIFYPAGQPTNPGKH